MLLLLVVVLLLAVAGAAAALDLAAPGGLAAAVPALAVAGASALAVAVDDGVVHAVPVAPPRPCCQCHCAVPGAAVDALVAVLIADAASVYIYIRIFSTRCYPGRLRGARGPLPKPPGAASRPGA